MVVGYDPVINIIAGIIAEKHTCIFLFFAKPDMARHDMLLFSVGQTAMRGYSGCSACVG